MARRALLCSAALLIVSLLPGAPRAAEPAPDAKGLEFFEKKIRPVLAEHCYRCHSAEAEASKKLKGGLKVDSREGLLQGGDSGPSLEPGKPEESVLLDVLRYDDAVQMPPKGKLPDAVIADFESWIKMGAPDPREAPAASAKKAGIDIEAGRKHWAYQPPRKPGLPAVRDAAWPAGEIDRFVLARLESRGLRPVADADRPTLIRRLYLDLIGLPPSPEEIDAFVRDGSPSAYEDLVDRLLASPRFGERWGRHWLDVARFAESLTLRGFIFKESWRYRDYVIEAFNADRPYDRFVREQLAGDLLPADGLDERRRNLVASNFLVLGNTNLEEQDKGQLRMDVVDEQIDAIGKGFLAQTIACARCHDHKFDPIPTKDYYAIAGILRNVKAMEHANVSKWLEKPLPVPQEQEVVLKAHEEAVASLEARIKAEKARVNPAKATVLAVGDVPGVVVDDAKARKVGEWKPSQSSGSYIGDGYIHDLNEGKGTKTLTFQPEPLEPGEYEVRLAYSPGGSRATAVPVTVFSADGETPVSVNMQPAPPIDGRFVSLGRHRFEKNGQAYVLISNEEAAGHVTADAVVFLPAEQATDAEAAGAGGKEAAEKADGPLKAMEAELKKLRASGPKRELVMTVEEEKEIGETKVHVRGNVHNLGEEAPRGFLRVATYGDVPAMPGSESGRRELAEWIAGEQNPLTARVFANRAWHWLFGAGLVRTTDNFGTTGEAPSHPELLDDLAVRFMEGGWSVKGLVRRIVLSRTYRLSGADDPKALAADPENRLLWRMNRRRLDAECLRDAMLLVGGDLSEEMGGQSYPTDLAADYGFRHSGSRRSVYAPVFRNSLPEFFEVFDFADPSMVTGRRDASTVAPQALFLMNHPSVREQARLAARRLLDEKCSDDRARLDRAYRSALGRPPTDAEARIGLDFLAGPGASEDPEEGWAAIFQALFASVDFRYVN
jgi:hypothetical protein